MRPAAVAIIGRNLIHYGAQLGWFFALTLIPLGQVVSIEFTMPIWTAILARAFLASASRPGRSSQSLSAWSASSSSFVLPRRDHQGQLIALAAAVGFGVWLP